MPESQRPQHMIAIVAENGVDAISPAFDQRFGVQRIVLLTTPALALRARDLANIARAAGKACEVENLLGAWRPTVLQDQLQRLLDAQHHEPWLINLSGANPALATTLFQLARERGIPAFVIEPEADKAVWLIRPEPQSAVESLTLSAATAQKAESVDVADRLGLRQYFASCGYALLHASATLNNRNFRAERCSKFLGDLALHHPRILLRLNRAGAELDPQLRSLVRFDASDLQALDFLVQLGFLRWHHHDQVQFTSGDARNFLCGGWLEYYVFSTLAELAQTQPIQDAALGLIVRTRQQASSEFDVAFMSNNHLFLIECKSRAPRRSHGVGMDVLFKLASLADQQGLNSRAMLVSLSAPTPAEAQRAESQHIELLWGGKLVALQQHLREWIDT